MSLTYKQSGVNIGAGEDLVNWLKSEKTPRPHEEKIVSGVGGFAALFKASFSDMKSPCLVSSTDGVGTKLKLATDFNQTAGVAQDLVAMCVNDLLCSGADPLFFLDYYACGKLDIEAAKIFLSSLKKACLLADCALIGGETAEMPGMYQNKDFDCAGFCVGVVDQDLAWGPHKIQYGDRLLGVSSSGFHSNGYSLIREIFKDDLLKWKDELLMPTEIYVKLVQKMKLEKLNIHGAAHITGGGINNLTRILPKNSFIDLKLWKIPSIFLEAQSRAGLTVKELLETFNCGVGFVFSVDEKDFTPAQKIVDSYGYKSFDLGCIKKDLLESSNTEQIRGIN